MTSYKDFIKIKRNDLINEGEIYRHKKIKEIEMDKFDNDWFEYYFIHAGKEIDIGINRRHPNDTSEEELNLIILSLIGKE